MRRSLRLPVAFAAGGFLAWVLPAQVLAGNMILTIDTLPAVEVSGLRTAAENAGGTIGGGSGAGKPVYKAFEFAATQSAMTPTLLKQLTQGKHFQQARLQVFTSDGLRLTSEWALDEVFVSAVSIEGGAPDPKAKAPNTFQLPETKFSLQFAKYCYKVFAADGSVAGQMCYDLKAATVQ
jgi:type VI protein secretion system component Hcp